MQEPSQQESPSLNKNSSSTADKLPTSVCKKCRIYLGVDATERDVQSNHCKVCLGLWNIEKETLQNAIQKAASPYGSLTEFSNQFPPSVAISGDVLLRYRLACEIFDRKATPSDEFLSDLKQFVKNMILQSFPVSEDISSEACLCAHVILTPSDTTNRPPFTIQKKRVRKRYRGQAQQQFPQQGGDARVNLEERLGDLYWNAAETEATLDRAHPSELQELQKWFQHEFPPPSFTINTAVWRRPFFIMGKYTKSRRDVSQTPFYVCENGSMKRLGVSSVEEEICPILAQACGGISKQNNSISDNNTLFGMVKFHASGREDMDVRMLLPPNNNKDIGGRPFCCQVIDAHRLSNQEDLQRAEREINHLTGKDGNDEPVTAASPTDKDTTSIQVEEDDMTNRHYGRNPMGVDVFGLELTSGSYFKELQAETESKVKHYGCLCWCEMNAEHQQHLEKILSVDYPLEIKQQTPIRVLHRRTNSVRTRHVLTLQAIYLKSNWFRLHLSTDAGTYVKEFVHGDLGRTVPSIASLMGCKTDILELDCEGIDMGNND